jgi:periplasmic protein TonB
VIGANTFIKSATIRTSSGYAVLDDLALDMVRKGKPLVQIPAALRGREFTVDVPVIFSLRAG